MDGLYVCVACSGYRIPHHLAAFLFLFVKKKFVFAEKKLGEIKST